jgi:flavin-dependent dehydrogenase
MPDHDLLILGGGPGGLSTALHLARDFPRLIPRMLVLEKARYPRPKLCAGGLMADAELILERLGLDVNEIPHADAHAAHLDFAGRGMSVRLRGRHILRIIRRDEFDAWLARKAAERGIEIRQGVTVKNVETRENNVLVETDAGVFRAQAVVGADGSNGVTRRCVLPDEPVYTARVLEVVTPPHVVEQAALSRSNVPHATKDAYFDFFCVPNGIAGYTWDFPTQIDGRPMRCWGIYDTNLLASLPRPPLKEPLAEEMRRHGFDLQADELKGHPIRWFDPFNRICAPRVVLVGDAAGADPIFGEGISIALGYGALAAQAIGEAFQRGEFSFRGYKSRLLRSALGRALIARWFIAQLLYGLHWTWFQRALWRSMGWLIWPVSSALVFNWARRTGPARSRSNVP